MKISPSAGDFQACRNEVLKALSRVDDAGLTDDTIAFINKKKVTIAMMQDLVAILHNNNITQDTIAQLRHTLKERVGCFGSNINKIAYDLKRIRDNNSEQTHIITQSKTVVTKSAVAPTAEPPSQCMLISKKTGYRCKNINPKYKLVPISNPNPTITYYTCGHCSQDKTNAWWRSEFTRVKIRA